MDYSNWQNNHTHIITKGSKINNRWILEYDSKKFVKPIYVYCLNEKNKPIMALNNILKIEVITIDDKNYISFIEPWEETIFKNNYFLLDCFEEK